MNRRATDEELVRRIRAGDESAYEELFARHASRLRGMIRRRLPANLRRKEAESDVIQEAWLGAFQKLPDFEDRGDGSFRAWFLQIADHKMNDSLRRYVGTAKRGLDREITRQHRAETRDFRSPDPSPSCAAMASELEARVEAAFARLPPDYAEVLRLVQQKGLTLADAAKEMGRSKAAVSKLYGRALSRLASLVEESE